MDSNLEPDQGDIARVYPHWKTEKGVDGLFHGRRTRGAALTCRGEDWQDLLDQIKRAEAMLEDTRPAGWTR